MTAPVQIGISPPDLCLSVPDAHTMREDDLATRVVEHFEVTDPEASVNLEEPYDHDGVCGVADVHVRTRTPERVDYLVELKGDAAIRHATGANEILRQYRRMERYFYQDEAHNIRPKLNRNDVGVHLLLLFAPTPITVRHVANNRSLYGSVDPTARVHNVPAARRVAFLSGLDGPPEDLGFLSINGDVEFGSRAFLRAIPEESRLETTIGRMDDLGIQAPGH